MKALDRKLLRELWRLRGQALAVAVVVASGVAVLVMSLSTLEALQATTDAYYERYRFADVFANAVRAPRRIAERVAQLPGVQSVERACDALCDARRRRIRGADHRPSHVDSGERRARAEPARAAQRPLDRARSPRRSHRQRTVRRGARARAGLAASRR